MKKKALSSLSFTFLICLILSSCTLSNDVVSNKKIQKRKYQKGLFLAKENKSKMIESGVVECLSPKMKHSPSQEEIITAPSLAIPSKENSNSVAIADKEAEKVNLKKIIKTIREANKAEKLASDDTTESKLEKISSFLKEKFNSKYVAVLNAANDFKTPTQTDLVKLGIALLALGLALFILGMIASVASGGLGSLFYLLSSLAWLGGLICLILYFVDEYDL